MSCTASALHILNKRVEKIESHDEIAIWNIEAFFGNGGRELDLDIRYALWFGY